MRYSFKKASAFLILILQVTLIPRIAKAHKGEVHNQRLKDKKEQATESLKLASAQYLDSVQSIFKKSCFDCHGTASEMPWYYKVPGIKGMIDADMREAKKHLDMSKGFPFDGHGSVVEDLAAIEKSISEETMPPKNYRVMHPAAKLSDEEKKIISTWIKDSLAQMPE